MIFMTYSWDIHGVLTEWCVHSEGQHENADNLCYNGINLLFYRNFLDIEKPFEYSDIFLFSKPLYRLRFIDEG